MAGHVPAIHVLFARAAQRTWITGTSAQSKASSPRPVMTTFSGSVLSRPSWPGLSRLVPAIHVLAGTKDVDHWDVGAKQSFVASPGDDDFSGSAARDYGFPRQLERTPVRLRSG